MLIDVNGVNPAFKDQVIKVVEGIEAPYSFKLTNEKGTGPQSMVFECDSDDDAKKIATFLKGAIKKSEVGSIMYFQVVPHGQFML